MPCTQKIYVEEDVIDTLPPTTIIQQPGRPRVNLVPIKISQVGCSVPIVRSATLTQECGLTHVAILTETPNELLSANFLTVGRTIESCSQIAPQGPVSTQTFEIPPGRVLSLLSIMPGGQVVSCQRLSGIIDEPIILRERNGELILGATYQGSLEVSGRESRLPARPGQAGFVARFGYGGECLWIVEVSSDVTSVLGDIQLDEIGNVFLTGSYVPEGELRLKSDRLSGGATIEGGGSGLSAFLGMIDRDGQGTWLTRIGPIPSAISSIVTGQQLAIRGGILTLTGLFNCGNLRFYQPPFQELTEINLKLGNSRGSSEIYLARFTTQGVPIWARSVSVSYQPSDQPLPLSLAVGVKNQIFLSSISTRHLFLDQDEIVVPIGTNEKISWVMKFNTHGSYKWVVWVTGTISSLRTENNILQLVGTLFPRTSTISFFDSQLRRKQVLSRPDHRLSLTYLTEYRFNGQYVRSSKQLSGGAIREMSIVSPPCPCLSYGSVTLASQIEHLDGMTYDVYSSDGRLAESKKLAHTSQVYIVTMALIGQRLTLPPATFMAPHYKEVILESVAASQDNSGVRTLIRVQGSKLFENGVQIDHLCLDRPVVLVLEWNGCAWNLVERR